MNFNTERNAENEYVVEKDIPDRMPYKKTDKNITNTLPGKLASVA